ncbi:integral membrane protein [Stylonychia lemnae]|uniref:Integral membrane protein n=1 Tax=Stylonychia lemnae TaxID=5949 RepID=A0A078AXH5_STYLE|nr:integral membrane protein [Stylonychia lemnae]|eukprot:CDW87165.1 integral membrane protein [Stylonychia lemnae]
MQRGQKKKIKDFCKRDQTSGNWRINYFLGEQIHYQMKSETYKSEDDRSQISKRLRIFHRCSWIVNIWKITDLEVKNTCGIDAALYLIYLKYIALCSNIFLLPLFITSEQKHIHVRSTLEKMTLINAQDRNEMIWMVFFFTILYSILVHIFISAFDNLRKNLCTEPPKDDNQLTEQEVSMRTLLIRGINKNISQREAKYKIEQIFKQILDDDLINVHVVAEMTNIIQILKELERTEMKKDYYDTLYREDDVIDWKFEFAPCPSDIFWDKFNKKSSLRIFKIIMINLMIFLFTVVLISPISILNSLEPYIYSMQNEQNVNSFIGTLIALSISPIILFIFNQVFIPNLVDLSTYYEEIENKSQRHRSNLFKQLVFLLLNTVFMPITQTTTIESFLVHVIKEDISDIQLELSSKFLKTSEFFLRYIIQCTFMNNIFQLLDAPHQLYLLFVRCCKKNRPYLKQNGRLEDNWYFDISYHFAFSITVFIIIMIFSASVPLIPLFGFFYFSIRYFVDKYNFMFVYQTEFQSTGVLGKGIIRYTALALIIFQITMCGLFTSIFGQDFLISSAILIIGEILFMITYKLLKINELKDAYSEVIYGSDSMDINSELIDDFITKIKKPHEERAITSLIHKQIIKDAYLHPYEVNQRRDNIMKSLNVSLKNDIQRRLTQSIDRNQSLPRKLTFKRNLDQ